ncbi:TonB-dependent siderophore receptor [Asticcacaulis sp. AC402]|uniref:TonB-dependent receptor plug domain-containing protein n=1 Tax=Asticcacaulis sp. AC402 TaxID=1282361 RepID=UPI0003C40D00|nr:TonB-dependent receptor [Asticcacaulis sp. AC402]ESQ73857.1 hypothetical protein ABAC402_17055 [Asticcacaulis sp. AC402]
MSLFRRRATARLYVTTALVLSLSGASVPVFAQDAVPVAEEPTEVVVTGTRTPRRSRLDTLAPVDVIKAETLSNQGSTELAEGLSKIAPSITFPRPAVTDGTDSVRPATLRGMSPDQSLVLINGKRRHASSLVNINGSVGRGAAAVDLNTIPEAALSTVEVLRDGASAQYGSDAIAGVINLRLRKASSGGGVTVSYGQYDTDVETANTSYHKSDGATTSVSGWVGLPLLDDGFLTVSGELKNREATSRGGLDTRITPASVVSRYGDPEETAITLFANAGLPLNDVWSLYGWASFQDRDNESAANFRPFNNSGNVLAIYPNGFLPKIQATTRDWSGAFGTEGSIGDWASDFSLVFGENQLTYHTNNSVNASFGINSQTDFYSGKLIYGQGVINANFSRSFELGWLAAPLDVGFGFEARSESYRIEAGELQSWAKGPVTAPQGAQGFPGLFPQNENDKSRSNVGAYLDLESKLTEKLSFGVALRAESYSDFGENTSGKLSARYDFTDAFAIRGSASTGFRAPSLQQQYFSSSATNFVAGVAQLITTFPVSSDVAKALGAAPLKAEDSENLALGFVFHKGPFELTVDGYDIKVTDRIILSENLLTSSNAGVAGLLNPFGVDGARFFINGVDTTTKGIDIVARYRLITESLGTYDLGLAANHGETTIDRFPVVNTLSTLPVPPALFARVNQNLLASSTPEDKYNLSLDWKLGSWSASANAVYYSSILVAQTNANFDFETGDKTLVNLVASYRFPGQTTLTLGVDNAFDVYPDATPLTTLANNLTPPPTAAYNGAAAFSARAPFGFNGRFLYARVSKSW